MAWLPSSLSTHHDASYPASRKTRFQVLVRLSWTGFPPVGLQRKVSNSPHAHYPPFPSLLGTILFSVTDLSSDVKPGGEGFGEALCGFADGQAVVGGPEIKGVALGLALGMEAAEHAFA
jgi:hypothetical protein